MLRSRAEHNSGDSGLQIAVSAANLSFTEAPIWGISDKRVVNVTAVRPPVALGRDRRARLDALQTGDGRRSPL